MRPLGAHTSNEIDSKRAERLSNLRAPRPARLPRGDIIALRCELTLKRSS